MRKRVLHHYQTKLRPISGWYFLVIAVLFFSIAAFALRQNNLKMIELRDAVYQADASGEDVEEPLRQLRQHVHSHMNTDLVTSENAIRPPIQLTHKYDRLVSAEQERVGRINEDVYARAEETCERRFPAGQLANGRVQCVENYVRENGVQPQQIPKELYQFDFASPRWSPDLAGWSLILGGIAVILFVCRFLLELWLSYNLRK